MTSSPCMVIESQSTKTANWAYLAMPLQSPTPRCLPDRHDWMSSTSTTMAISTLPSRLPTRR